MSVARLRFDDSISKDEIITRMADTLRRTGIPQNERDAIRLLAASERYGYGDIMAFAEDALTAARQSSTGGGENAAR